MKKLLSYILTLTMIASCFALSACSGGDPVETREAKASTDKYRNFYEIFVGSFADSNDDGVGDLQGIIDKLDYLNDGDPAGGDDLGIDGIWLTPIMPSHSYHKYDVKDYFDIDESFGDLKTFDKLVKACHKRGIKVIIDLVLNHSSSYHPLFESAVNSIKKNGKPNKDAEYYEIKKFDGDPDPGYRPIANGYYYEGNFSEYMPEWNLNAQKTRDYFIDIAKFWLKDHNVDGFRLDATLYYTNSHTDGVEFLKWFYNEAKKINPDVYMVGENWTGSAEIQEMYDTNIDSFFAFPFADANGTFVNAVRTQNGQGVVSSVKKFETKTKEHYENAINSYFLSNHDQKRSANFVSVVGESGVKMAAALYMLMPGNSYIYYGEEIGMSQDSTLEDDEYKREPMIWDSKKLPGIVVNGKASADADHAEYGGVKQQKADDNSIFNFYKRVIKIKNQNPAIARGELEELDLGDNALCAYTVKTKDESLIIVHNLSNAEEKTAEIEQSAELYGDLVASGGDEGEGDAKPGKVTLSGSTLTLPPYSTAILGVK